MGIWSGYCRKCRKVIVICALTSVGAFLCLVFLDSSVLHDLGWFAAISITGAAFSPLFSFPRYSSGVWQTSGLAFWILFIDKIGKIRFEDKPAMIIILRILTDTSLYFFKKSSVLKRIWKPEFVDPSYIKPVMTLKKLSAGKYKNIYIVATGKDREEDWGQWAHQNHLTVMMIRGSSEMVSGIRTLMFSDSLSNARLSNEFIFYGWTIPEIIARVNRSASAYGFKPLALKNSAIFLKVIQTNGTAKKAGLNRIVSEWLMDRPGLSTVQVLARGQARVNQETVIQAFQLTNVMLLSLTVRSLTERFPLKRGEIGFRPSGHALHDLR